MKKVLQIVIFSLVFFTSFWIVNANNIDFYWEKKESWDMSDTKSIEYIVFKLEEFYKKTGLNTDFVILWKWDSCYLKSNFDSCIQKRENYSSDLIVVLSMKSDQKIRWDIRSLIKEQFKEIISPRELKEAQDSITYNFKNQYFKWGLVELLDVLSKKIDYKCWIVWLWKWCNMVKLAKDYHNYLIIEDRKHQDHITKLIEENKYNAMMKNIYILLSIVLIIIFYFGFKKIYIFRINNLFKDIRYKSMTLDDFELFKKDKKEIIDNFDKIYKKLEIKLWNLDKNILNLVKVYNKNKNEFEKINTKLEKMQDMYKSRGDLKEKLDKAKKIDL